MRSHNLLGAAAPAFATLALAVSSSAAWSAENTDRAGDTVEEVVVTATKQGESTVLTTPISIQAFNADQLQQVGATSFDDFYRMIPGLSAWDQGPGNKRIILRGINSTGAGTVGLYLDEAVVTGENSKDFGGLQPDPKLFDMERLEVLKGPQGSTFGASAMSGVIRYITNKPDLEHFGGSYRVGITQQDYAGTGTNMDGALNLPIITNEFAIRLSGYYQNSPGWIDSRYQQGVNDDHTRAARVEMRLKTGERGTLDLLGQLQDTDTDGLPYYTLTNYLGQPLNRRYYQGFLERDPFTDHSQIESLVYTYELDSGTITATASNVHRFTDIVIPGSQVIAAGLKLPLAAADTDGVRSRLDNEKWRDTENYEVRYASHFQGPVQTLVGLYRSDERRNELQTLPTVDSLGYVDPSVGVLLGPNFLDSAQLTHIHETALFGEATWSATSQLKITVGGRAFRFQNESQADVISSFGSRGSGFGPRVQSDQNGGIGRFNAQYSFNDQTSTYLQVAQGYRPGGTNNTGAGVLGGVTIPAGYNSDRLVSYEVGFKQASFDDRLRVTAAAYFINWTDLQVQLQTPLSANGTTFPYTGNAGAAHVKGLELEVEAAPVKGLHLGLAAGYTDALITQGVPGTDAAGDRMPYTPKETVSGTVDYRFPLVSGYVGFVGADASWTSSRVTSFPATPRNYYQLDSYAVANARVGVDVGNVTMSLLVKNLFNNKTVLDAFVESTGMVGFLGDPPRMVELQVAGKF